MAYVEVNPRDAEQLRIEPGAAVCISSRRDSVVAHAFITPTISPGQLFMPMHYNIVNRLTLSVFDPYSRQPAYKACAVNLKPVS
jgi:assimilatory nitrate reductase catalytic subunit